MRATLIAATATIIATQGLGRLTVDAVAKAAGVTKGGLFHHFANKQALIDGVIDEMLAIADETVERLMADDPEPHGRFTRAMLKGALEDRTFPQGDAADAAALSTRTLCLALLADPLAHQRWSEWYAERMERHADTDGSISCAIVRLAIDGIWLASVHNRETEPIAAAIQRRLLEMTAAGP